MNYDAHPQLERLAADYVMGTMPSRTRRRFEAITRRSPAAQAAVDAWTHRLHLLSRVDFELDPSPAVFEDIERRIDQSQRAGTAAADAPRRAGWRWWRAVAGFALGVLMTSAVVMLQAPPYETLTTPAPGAAAQGPTLRVLFAPGTTIEQMNAALRSVDAIIVAGPTALGVLTVAVPRGPSAQRALAALRAMPAVRLAEPVVAPKASP